MRLRKNGSVNELNNSSDQIEKMPSIDDLDYGSSIRNVREFSSIRDSGLGSMSKKTMITNTNPLDRNEI